MRDARSPIDSTATAAAAAAEAVPLCYTLPLDTRHSHRLNYEAARGTHS